MNELLSVPASMHFMLQCSNVR
uniref:Uncharacterized protein n=1 Tax=Arundo donax TaxID=35708 RepID=A0A0A9A757_ARUDO